MSNLNEHGQDTGRDPAYGTTNFTHEGSYALFTPMQWPDNSPASVRILGDDDEAMQKALEDEHKGDYMTGCPSIELTIPTADGNGAVTFLTWQEAYNLGRALIEKANEAHYG